MTGFDDRIFQNVASGAGGTAGSATHWHMLGRDSSSPNKAFGTFIWGESYQGGHMWVDAGAGIYTYERKQVNTEASSHLPPALKVLLCKKT